ncbi:ABC transporter permease [Campylobacter sp. FMV-PI01]|uniref:ABC transporter permease n=1 Tax=Campylobacter portucalensis TaxID=2608384 RepID=A0A6L5WMY6_9BACT|nr:methionine ABC transporter permease [Campylobacter portucalensis]MSN97031.1 ABC transporter permease [Campylobacter portucalensis]
MKKIIFLTLILGLFFIYPFFMGENIFESIDKIFFKQTPFFRTLFDGWAVSLKEILGNKSYKILIDILLVAAWETLYMTITSTVFAAILGLFLAIILVFTRKDGLLENRPIYNVLDFIINVFRSFPFIVLIIVLFPFVRLIIGTSIGTDAAIVPLTIGTAPFMARLIENALIEVDKGVIEAAKSFGASKTQIIFRVMLVEAVPSLINVLTLTIIVVIGFSAMAGTLGGGGLGDVAIRYGFQRFRGDIMLYTVIILIAMVQIVQMTGNQIYKKVKK